MPATPGELALLAQLTKLSAGQASGSFGPGQALALLSGYVKLRDRVDLHGENLQTVMDEISALQAALDAALARVSALEVAEAARDAALADLDARLQAYEQATNLRLDALEQPPPPPPTP